MDTELIQEEFQLLQAVGLLHPSMKPWDLFYFNLADAVWEDTDLRARVLAHCNLTEADLEAKEDGTYLELTGEDYTAVIEALTAAEQNSLRVRVAGTDGFKRWAAARQQ